MKHLIISALFCLFIWSNSSAQGLVLQDTIFTPPVTLSDAAELVTLHHGQFVPPAGALPFAKVNAQQITGCAPMYVNLGATQSKNVSQWHWFCPGGSPEESFAAAPIVTYADAGTHQISLVIRNSNGSDTLRDVISVEVMAAVSKLSFTTEVVGDSIICTNTTQNAETFFWTLNNGDPAGLNTNPQVFKADTSGTYTIGLTVAGSCDFNVVNNTVKVLLSGSKRLEGLGWQFGLSPNPNDGQFALNIVSPEKAAGQLSVLNPLGEVVYQESVQTIEGWNTYPVELRELPTGLYHLQFRNGQGGAVLRFVIR